MRITLELEVDDMTDEDRLANAEGEDWTVDDMPRVAELDEEQVGIFNSAVADYIVSGQDVLFGNTGLYFVVKTCIPYDEKLL